jgi:glycosyltransferase involved in cell wall biosynthesis
VTLSEAGGKVSTKGKLYSQLAAGRPILAIAPAGQEARGVVAGAGCGWSVDPDDAEGVARIVRAALDSPEELTRMGQAARECFDNAYSLDICARQFEAELMNLARTARTEPVTVRGPSG